MKSWDPQIFQITCRGQKVPLWQFFRKGWDGRALLVRLSIIPHRILKVIFVLGLYEFLAMLEGKIGLSLFS